MNNITQKEYFVIRGTTSSISSDLVIDYTKNYDHVTISSCSIPKTFYVIPKNCDL